MKWGVVIMLVLGLIAAASAALLMGTINVGSSASRKQPLTVEVAICKESLPTGTVITNELIVKEVVSRNEVPEGPLPNTLKIIGRVLAVPVVEGQVLTEACFVKEGIGEKLASQIPHGFRAVTVTVTSKIMPDSVLLYPGCVVDVLVCYTLRNRGDGGEAVSQTMLVGIRVLAISGDTVVSQTEEEGGAKKRPSRGTRVTLLVTPKQVQALQLAADNGSLSMTLRNPLDKQPIDEEPSVLDRNSIRREGDTMPPTISTDRPLPGEIITPDNNQPVDSNNISGTNILGPQFRPSNTYQKQKKSRWEVETFNGREKKIQDFDEPANKAGDSEIKK
jgi:Flp pilus assembly protein CpaB